MEPTIYKPSIYKGAGIYKTGAGGGGGGGGDLPEGYTKHYALKVTNSIGSFAIPNNLKISGIDTVYFKFNLDTNSAVSFNILYGNNLYIQLYYGGDDSLVCVVTLATTGANYASPAKSNGDISLIARDVDLMYNGVLFNSSATLRSGEFTPTEFLKFRQPMTMLIYSFDVVANDGTAKNKFVPAENANGDLGLFDVVNNEFSQFSDQSNITAVDF